MILFNTMNSSIFLRNILKRLNNIDNVYEYKSLSRYLTSISDFRIKNYNDFKTEIIYDKNIMFNKYGYSKNIIYSNNLLTAFVVFWKPFSETSIHGHARNGCHVLKIDGTWQEELYKNDGIIESRGLTSGNVCFIDNSIGKHKMYYTGNDMGVSLNIYSPTADID